MVELKNVAHSRLVVLEAGSLRAVLAPDVGGSIASFSRQWREARDVREVHWLRPATAGGLAARNPLAMASFPLVPFCNRLRHGSAEFGGRAVRVPPNHPSQDAPHPLHGFGWLRRWELDGVGASQAELSWRCEASAAWPWRFVARQAFTLSPSALEVTLAVTNEDTVPMPLGLGHHPYFPHHPGTRLRSAAAAMWRTDAEVMPVALEEGRAVRALREGVELSRLVLDNNFAGWQRTARIDWPADVQGPARCLVLEAEAPLDHFVVYSPAGLDHFCAEPVSQCTDWLNLLPGHDAAMLGGAVLEPGQTLSTHMALRPAWG